MYTVPKSLHEQGGTRSSGVVTIFGMVLYSWDTVARCRDISSDCFGVPLQIDVKIGHDKYDETQTFPNRASLDCCVSR